MFRLVVNGHPDPARDHAVEQAVADAFATFVETLKTIDGAGMYLALFDGHYGVAYLVGGDTTFHVTEPAPTAPRAVPPPLSFAVSAEASDASK